MIELTGVLILVVCIAFSLNFAWYCYSTWKGGKEAERRMREMDEERWREMRGGKRRQ